MKKIDQIMKVQKNSDVSNLVKETDLNAKITEVEGKRPSISGLATSLALTTVENKIPHVGKLVKRTDYNTKASETEKKITDHNHDKYITTPQFNRLTGSNFQAKLKQAKFITKRYLDTESKN